MVSMPRPAVLVRLLPLAVAVALTCAAAAVAVPPVCNDPTECEPGGGGDVVTTINPDLFVATTNGGTIQDSPLANINCGSDCTQGGTTYTYTRTCGDPCTYENVDTVRLVGAGGPAGFSPSWSLCRANPSTGVCADADRFECDALEGSTCVIEMYDDTRAQMTWVDTTDPNTAFSSPPAVVGPNVRTFTASPSDNAGVARVEFSIDGVFVGQDTTAGDGFSWTVNLSPYSDGSAHTLTARAIDTSGRSDPTPASTNFTVDKSTQIAISAPAAGSHSQTAPQFTFSIEAGASAVCKTLSGASGDTSLHEAACTSSYTPQATTPGEYRVRISSTDAVGNAAIVDRAFAIDAPTQQPTGGQTEQPGSGEQGGGTSQVTAAAILAGLGKDLEVAARGLARQRQSRLARARGRSISVNALTAGTFALVFRGAAGRARASRTVTIGRGRVVAAGAGRYTLRLKLTKAGARLLRRGRRVSGRLTMSFTTPSGSKLSGSRKVTMKRR